MTDRAPIDERVFGGDQRFFFKSLEYDGLKLQHPQGHARFEVSRTMKVYVYTDKGIRLLGVASPNGAIRITKEKVIDQLLVEGWGA